MQCAVCVLVAVCVRMCVCVCVNNTIQTQQNSSSLFSFSSCALLALLTAIVSPSSFTALPSERGHRDLLSALFENVITTIMMIVLMMMIMGLMEIKGGESERVCSSWGEATPAL